MNERPRKTQLSVSIAILVVAKRSYHFGASLWSNGIAFCNGWTMGGVIVLSVLLRYLMLLMGAQREGFKPRAPLEQLWTVCLICWFLV